MAAYWKIKKPKFEKYLDSFENTFEGVKEFRKQFRRNAKGTRSRKRLIEKLKRVIGKCKRVIENLKRVIENLKRVIKKFKRYIEKFNGDRTVGPAIYFWQEYLGKECSKPFGRKRVRRVRSIATTLAGCRYHYV